MNAQEIMAALLDAVDALEQGAVSSLSLEFTFVDGSSQAHRFQLDTAQQRQNTADAVRRVLARAPMPWRPPRREGR